MIASPFKLLKVTSLEHLVQELLQIIKEQNVERVVIGFPVREDGQESPVCKNARELLKELEDKDIDALLWDERYSSKIARNILCESGIKTKNSRDKLDAVAASVLLENYLAYYKRNQSMEQDR
jgi:putative Holliday junction resolvase